MQYFAAELLYICACLLRSFTVGARSYSWPTVDCYSCMSKSYESYWSILQQFYWPQKNVTNVCNEGQFDRYRIATVPCKTICIMLKEPLIYGGITVGQQYIRGCYDKILMNGFNESAIETHRFRNNDMCRTLDRPRLMKFGDAHTQVTICSCWQSRCNGARSSSMQTVLPTTLLPVLFVVLLQSLIA